MAAPPRQRSARAAWAALECLHAVVYFHPCVADEMAGVGLRGFWRSYFAGRLGPMGAIRGSVAHAVVAGFASAMVERAVPAVWEMADPDAAAAAWTRAGARALGELGVAELLPDEASLALVRALVVAWPAAGRPLGAAWRERALSASTADLTTQWWLWASAWRELRGDGHVAALAVEGLDGALAHAVRLRIDGADASWQQRARGFDDTEWAKALAVAADPVVGPQLRAGYERAEAATDQAASWWWPTGVDGNVESVTAELMPAARRAAAALPFPNPIGLPAQD